MDTSKFIERASRSSFHLWILNWILHKMIPFNKPHGLKVLKISKGHTEIMLPFKKKNLNHIRGLHACSLATLAEYTTGLTLITQLDPKEYRIIMQELKMEYHYQGKKNAVTNYTMTDEWVKSNVKDVLESAGNTIIHCEIPIYDINKNHLATGHINWQVKPWSQVKTKM